MKESILKRFPGLKESDFILEDRGDGNGIRISLWNNESPMPTMDEVLLWIAEDDALPKPLTPFEELQKQQADLIFELMMNGVI